MSPIMKHESQIAQNLEDLINQSRAKKSLHLSESKNSMEFTHFMAVLLNVYETLINIQKPRNKKVLKFRIKEILKFKIYLMLMLNVKELLYYY